MALNFLLTDFPIDGDILSLRVPPCGIKVYKNLTKGDIDYAK